MTFEIQVQSAYSCRSHPAECRVNGGQAVGNSGVTKASQGEHGERCCACQRDR